MASIVPGYEYDIFISYRQKDNKHDGWVTEFVDNLKGELESTFKEEISVYFDINPHDGLLETHDVDESLKEKLKCLIFIPIISRTYCDPKSFAWEHEFKAFIEQASKDQFGLKIKLLGGNVANRVLPVRIHDLDITDIKLCESVIGGVLRGVDFIYKSAGVNRPLRANEDHPKDNFNKTYYRDQINKVANALNDIIHSLTHGISDSGEKFYKISGSEGINRRKTSAWIKIVISCRNFKRRIIILLAMFVCLSGAYIIYRSSYLNNTEKTIAFIPLRNLNNDTTLISDGVTFIEAVYEKISKVKSVMVIPIISTYRYKDTDKSPDVIRKELRSNYLVDGYIRREGKNTKINIELSAAKDNKILWSKPFTWDKNQISKITQEIVRVIAYNLDLKLSSEEKKLIEKEASDNPDANLNYINANVISRDAWFFYNYGNKLLDSTSFNSAIETYDKVLKEDSLFAVAYAKRAIAISWGYYVGQLDSTSRERCKKDIDKALSIDKNLIEAEIALGFYYYYFKNEFEQALYHFNKAAEKDPQNYQPLFYMALVYRKMGKWAESQNLIYRVIRYNPQEAIFLTNIGLSYTYLHKYDSALIYHQKAIDYMPGWSVGYKNKINVLILKKGKTSEARAVLEDAIKKTGESMIEYRILLDMYERKYSDVLHEAEISNPADFNIKGNRYLYLAKINSVLNNPEVARTYYDSACVILNQDLKNDPNNSALHGALGIAYAGLGSTIKAIAEGERAIKLAVKNKMDESDMKINLAQIYTMAGEYVNALSNIAYLLNNPSFFSESLLQIDPVWKPLMDQPEFRTKIRKYSKN